MELVKLQTTSMFAVITVYLLLFSSFCEAQSRPRPVHPLRGSHINLPPLPKLSKGYVNTGRFYANGSACIESPPAFTPAPKKNVWSQLKYDEVVAVREFMYDQKELNLSAGYGGYGGYYGYGGSSSGTIVTLGMIELNPPNKTDVLPYLEGTGPEPYRYAKTQIQTSKAETYEIQEIIVGPILADVPMTWAPLAYPFTRAGGKISETFNPAHYRAADKFAHQLKNQSQDIFQTLWPWLNHTWDFYSGIELPVGLATPENNDYTGKNAYWYTSWTSQGGDNYALGYSFPLSLYFGVQVNDNDVHNPTFLGWIYDNVLYSTTDKFRHALKHGNITKPIPTHSGAWSEGGQHGPTLPMDYKPPPQAIAPAGSRFYLDHPGKYVQWMDFSFYMAHQYNRGWAFYDIRHKGKRIIYELALQEALAHYAGTDPSVSLTWYRDAGTYSLGSDIVELVSGYDCPAYARYWDTWAGLPNDGGYQVKNSVCFFEFDADFPIARHSAQYVAARKNIYFVVRSVYTVGNYDYMFSYEFYLDGSIKVTVRASGYIEGAGAVGNHDYGYRIHGGYSGSMHDHVLNFKVDFDIEGTKNTMQLTSFVPTNQDYLWTKEPRETFKLKREIIQSEDNSRIDWDRKTQYAIVNRDQPNEWGEYRGYRIMPADGTTHFSNKKSSNAKELIHPFTFDMAVTQFHDTEPLSTSPNDETDLNNPLVNFDKFFNGESLVQEDLVTWINLGMHHLPQTLDLPFTLLTTAHASVQFTPLNYYPLEVSTQTLSQVQVNFGYHNGTDVVTKVNTYGQAPAWCSIDLSKDAAPDLFHELGGGDGGYYK